MKKIAIALSGLLALGLGGWTIKKKLAKPSKYETITAQVTKAPIEETVDATGSVSPLNRVEVKPAISGRIEKLLVDEGDTVKQGQVIAWMSSTDRAAILDAARAQGPEVMARWQDTYKPTPLVSPLPGHIILRNVVEGQMVDATAVIYAMSDVLIVVGQVDESDIGRIKMGMPARITLDSFPDRQEEGKVFDILYEGKNVSNVIQYGVKIKVDHVPSYYRSQMTANISFIVKRKKDALLVPASAVRQVAGDGKQVLIPGQDGQPVWTDVKTGIETDQNVEIVAGLSDGDKILIRQAKYVPQEAAQSSPLTMGGVKKSPASGGAGGSRAGH